MKDEKDLNSTKMDQKGKNPGQTKKNPGRGKRFFSSPKCANRHWERKPAS
jgi:hypothetical protein